MSAKEKIPALRWRETKLGDVLPLKYGKARSPQFGYPRPDTQTFGSNGAFGTFDRALTTKPTLIVGRKGAAGAVHYSSDPCWPIDTAFYSEGSEGVFLPFFRYLLESLQLVRLDRSTAIPSLSRDDYDARVVQHPESEAEQRRIVAEIEKQFTRLEAGVAALRRVQANLKRYRAAVLKAACDGELVPHKTPSKDWSALRLADVCKSITDGDHQPPPKRPQGIPLLTIGNISSGKLDFSDTRFVPEEYYNQIKPDRIPNRDEVLYSVVGATIGIPVLVNTDRLFCFSRHVALLKPSPRILPKFLWLHMASPDTHREAWRRITGSAQPTLALRPLREMPIKLPPLVEQTRIVAEVEWRLSVVEELESVVSANLQRSVRLRQSILQKAFTGQL